MGKQLGDNRGARALRRVKGSQQEIAAELSDGEEKLHQSSVCRWRSAELKPSFRWRLRLKKTFGIGMGWWDEVVTVSVREIRTGTP